VTKQRGSYNVFALVIAILIAILLACAVAGISNYFPAYQVGQQTPSTRGTNQTQLIQQSGLSSESFVFLLGIGLTVSIGIMAVIALLMKKVKNPSEELNE
jgi:hypothetical protein